MMNEIVCPVCGNFLADDVMGNNYFCHNPDCVMHHVSMSQKQWRPLIQTKQDLAKAIDVIDTVRQHKRGTAVIYPNDIAVYCDKALEHLEHKG